PRRRAGTGLDEWWQGIGVIGWPLSGAAAPSELAAADRMHDARGPIPGRPHVPFHVSVIGEKLTLSIEIHVVGIAMADADDFPGFAVGIGLGDPATGRHHAPGMAVGVPLAWQEEVFVPVGGN